MNPAVRLTISERDRVNWWAREPIYLDTKGLSGVPSGFDVRHFIDKNNQHLVAIDNWREANSISFSFYGEPRALVAPIDYCRNCPATPSSTAATRSTSADC